MRLRFLTLLAVCALLLGTVRGAVAAPPLTFSLDPATALPGATVTLTGTITNPADPGGPPADVLANDLSFGTVTGPLGTSAALTFDTNVFFSNVPGVFSAGDTYTGPIFGIKIAAGAPAGDYSGTVTILGSTSGDPDGTDTVAATPFLLHVAALAPEPGTGSLILATALPLLLARRRRG